MEMNPKKIIKNLRRKIPTFSCKPVCHGCCGPVIASLWELECIGGSFINFDDISKSGTFINFKDLPEARWSDIILPGSTVDSFHKRFGKNPLYQFAKDEGCKIYKKRPLICRLYGTVEDFKCPHGCKPKIMLTKAQGHAIMVEYCKMIQKGG